MTELQKKINLNLHYQGLLKWSIGDVGPAASVASSTFVDMVIAMQKSFGFSTADGILGPATYRSLLLDRCTALVGTFAPLLTHPVAVASTYAYMKPEDAQLARAGVLAITKAKLRWLENIVDDNRFPKSISAIDAVIRTSQGINWDWRPRYTADTFAWCGAEAAHDWSDSIDGDVRQDFWSSTYRLDTWFRYLDLVLAEGKTRKRYPNPAPASSVPGPRRQIINLDHHSTAVQVLAFAGTGPRPGDILIIGNAAYGQHVTVVDSYDSVSNTFTTYEGNGIGFGPDGTKREGVVRCTRKVGNGGKVTEEYIARRLGRPGYHDILLA